VYQVVLFFVVWGGWVFLSFSLSGSFKINRAGSFLALLLPALFVWWLMARNPQATITLIFFLIGLLTFLSVPIVAAALWWRSVIPDFLIIFAFPFLLLWIYLFKKLYQHVTKYVSE
jgi:hypothetical protein